MCATPKKKMIGSSAAAPSPIRLASGEWLGAKRGVDVPQIGHGEGETADDPNAGKNRGDEVRRARRAVLQRLQDLTD